MTKKTKHEKTIQQEQKVLADSKRIKGDFANLLVKDLVKNDVWKNLSEHQQRMVVSDFKYTVTKAMRQIIEMFIAQGNQTPILGTLKKFETVPHLVATIDNIQADDESILRLSKNGKDAVYILPTHLASMLGDSEDDLIIPDEQELFDEPQSSEELDVEEVEKKGDEVSDDEDGQVPEDPIEK